jgi:hypothetical protein
MRNIECLLSELYEMNELLNKLPDSNEKKYMQESYAKQLESALNIIGRLLNLKRVIIYLIHMKNILICIRVH